MQDILEILRVQRHDFMNHLQVISGLLQLNKPERAREYITEVAEELKKASVISRIGSAQIALTILRADVAARRQGITINCNISSNLDEGFRHGLPVAEIIKEMLETAVREVGTYPGNSGSIDLNLSCQDGEYKFQVSFSGQESSVGLSFASTIIFIEETAAKIKGRVKVGDSPKGVTTITLSVPVDGVQENQDARQQGNT